jgi:DNA-binding transcriptional ArsR family regulator
MTYILSVAEGNFTRGCRLVSGISFLSARRVSNTAWERVELQRSFFRNMKIRQEHMGSTDAIYKVLANPVRREILTWLREPVVHFPNSTFLHEHGVAASHICKCSGLSQSTISTHLAVMYREGLLVKKRVGQWVLFRRNEPFIQAFVNQMRAQL